MVSQSCRPIAVFSDFRPLLKDADFVFEDDVGPDGKHLIATDVQGVGLQSLFRWPQQVRLHCEVLSGPGEDDGDWLGPKVQLEGVIRWESPKLGVCCFFAIMWRGGIYSWTQIGCLLGRGSQVIADVHSVRTWAGLTDREPREALQCKGGPEQQIMLGRRGLRTICLKPRNA